MDAETMVAKPLATKRHSRLIILFLAVSAMIWVADELLTPDDCESKYHRVKLGMTESDVISVMSKQNHLRRLFTSGERIRRASGVSSLWTEEWYVGDKGLVGVHFQWDGSGRLGKKALFRGGEWVEASE